MKVLLISANSLSKPYPVYPLGLDYVAGALADAHEVEIADIQTQGNGRLAGRIRRFEPDIIGISLRNVDTTDSTDPQEFIGFYRQLAAEVRLHSKAPIVLGGSALTIFPDEIMKALDADYGVIGEGERICELIDAIEGNGDIAALPGVVTRDKPKPPPGPWQKRIFRKFDRSAEYLSYYLAAGGMLNLQTKRGCHYNCIYCTYPRIEGPELRLMDPQAVATTALQLQAAGAKYLYITDAVFNSDSAHTVAVAQAFKKCGLRLPWGAFFAPLKPPPDYYRILADAGLTHVEFGTESLSDRMLAAYRKPFDVKHVMAAHRAAVEAGLHVAHYFMLGGPGEDLETLAETLANVEQLDKALFIFFCGVRIYPNTPLLETAVKEGRVSEADSLLMPRYYHSPQTGPEALIRRLETTARGRVNWLIGGGGPETVGAIARLHRHGQAGPLWEHLIRQAV